MAVTRAIELKTEIPGPRSREIGERIAAAVARPLAITFPVVAASARGATLTDVDGNTFIDFAGGVGCLNVGHSHPDVVAAAHEQLDRFTHTDFTVVPYEIYVALAERLARARADLGPGQGGVLQRRHRGGRERRQVRARLHRAARGDRASRARSTAARCSRSRSPRRCTPTRPASARSRPRSTASRSRTPTGASRPRTRSPRSSARSRRWSPPRPSPRSCSSRCRARAASSSRRPSSSQACAAICDAHGIVLVADEVQTGFGRTGRFFAMEHSGVEPDLICVAKSIANGLPLSGVLGRAEIMDAPVVGGGRRHLRRQPGRAGRGTRRARRDRRRGPRRALGGDRARRSARGCSPGRSAGPRSARCGASARCWRSSSSPTRRRGSRRRSSRAA